MNDSLSLQLQSDLLEASSGAEAVCASTQNPVVGYTVMKIGDELIRLIEMDCLPILASIVAKLFANRRAQHDELRDKSRSLLDESTAADIEIFAKAAAGLLILRCASINLLLFVSTTKTDAADEFARLLGMIERGFARPRLRGQSP